LAINPLISGNTDCIAAWASRN